VIFGAVLGAEIVHAKFALLTGTELHAFWRGHDGAFPFSLLFATAAQVGGEPIALRAPLLVLFALLLGIALFLINRRIPPGTPTLWLVSATALLLAILGIYQRYAIHRLRADRHAYSIFCHEIERSAAPGETVMVASGSLFLSLDWYTPEAFRAQLAPVFWIPSATQFKPFHPGEQQQEFLYVGPPETAFTKDLRARGFALHQDDSVQQGVLATVASIYRLGDISIYFVSPPSASLPAAVSSSP
jgi:hypothetical protein